MSKDTVFYELFDRMSDNKCPVCELINDRTVRNMQGFLYESVNDVAVRKNICSSYGLCNYHAYLLMDMGDPLAHAIIYKDLLSDAISYFSAIIKKQNLIYQTHSNCIFCEQSRKSEDTYIKAFLEAFEYDDFKNRYISSGILCLPHLECIKNSKNPNADSIVQCTMDKYRGLINDLSEIIRKNDYRFSNEPLTESQKTAWKKAVEVVNSRRGIKK